MTLLCQRRPFFCDSFPYRSGSPSLFSFVAGTVSRTRTDIGARTSPLTSPSRFETVAAPSPCPAASWGAPTRRLLASGLHGDGPYPAMLRLPRAASRLASLAQPCHRASSRTSRCRQDARRRRPAPTRGDRARSMFLGDYVLSELHPSFDAALSCLFHRPGQATSGSTVLVAPVLETLRLELLKLEISRLEIRST